MSDYIIAITPFAAFNIRMTKRFCSYGERREDS